MWMKKSLGQNLLTDRNYQLKIVKAMNVGPCDLMIEIGPGLGAMTDHFLPSCLHYAAVEIDDRFAEALQSKFGDNARFELVHKNFLKIDLAVLANDLRSRFPESKSLIVFGNIPYNITTPIITTLIEQRVWDDAFLTVQNEYADRLVAPPGSKTYGSITLFVNYHLAIKKLFKIPSGVFHPIPKVDSAFLYLTPLAVPAVEVPDEELLFKIIRTAFSQRRKMLGNTLKNLQVEDVSDQKLFKSIEGCGINLKLRPEQLSISDFAKITKAIYKAVRT
jgi:16S rRNA (adenine1518-N6/adenine1519-N6)-dimethyltransferase